MVSAAQIRASNAQITERSAPRIAVFVGGTSGIGKAALTALVSKGTPVKIYIIGRDKASRKSWLESLQRSNSQTELVWLDGQVSLLAEVKRLCIEIKSRENSINLLFLCAGFLPYVDRNETSEGFETSLALLYWSRILFIKHLLPLLVSASSTRPIYAPRVISIAGSGFEDSEIPLDDLDLRDPQNFGTLRVARQAATLNTLALAHFAAELANQGIIFIHNHPGGVKTEVYKNGWGEKPIDLKLVPPAILEGMSPETSGERSLYLITSAQFGGKGVPLQEDVAGGLTVANTNGGALFCVNDKIECIQQESVLEQLKAKNADNIVWEKTQKVLEPYL